MKYSIIIPYHSNQNLLFTCLSGIFGTVPEDVEIIVVANNQNIKELNINIPSRCTLLKFNQSTFYPRAVNLGVQAAQGEYVILMDADICVCAGWLEALTSSFFSNSDTGGCSAKMLDPFDATVKEFGIGFTGFNFPHPFAGRNAHHLLLSSDRKVQAFCSATSMYKREIYLNIGGMDENLIDGYSDIDLCLRLHKQGLSTYVSANAHVYHLGSSTQASGMSAHLRADTKGYFMSHNGSECKVDMDSYYKIAFENNEISLQSKYFMLDFTTIANQQWHYDLFSELGHCDWREIYRFPSKNRNSSHIPLYTLLDDNFRRRPDTICYFVDDFRSLKNNYIWQELRHRPDDIVIDRNANILLLEDVI